MLVDLLRTHLRPHRRAALVVVVLQLLQTVATLYLPTLNADVIDRGVVTGDTGYVVRVGALMLLVTLVQVTCGGGAVVLGARTATALGRDVRAALFEHVQTLSTREVSGFGAASLITRTTNDVQQVQALVLMTFTLVVSAPIMAVGAVLLALRQDLPMSLLLLVVVPVLVAVVTAIVRRMRPLFRVVQLRIDAVNRVLREQITGVRVVRAFVRDEHERRRFGRTNAELRDVSLAQSRLMSLMFPSVMLVVNLAGVAVLWVGGHRIAGGHMQVGALTAFLSYLMQVLMAVMAAAFMFILFPRAEVSAERVQEVLRARSSVVPPEHPVTRLDGAGRVELRGASFQYPGAQAPVLSGVDLVALPGRTTAVIGSTGSGKTTLLQLVPRLFDATAGSVLVDGVDVRDIDPPLLAATVSSVPQRAYLFTGTVASNLRYGRPGAGDDELWHALEVAQAASFVRAAPEGLEAPVAQGGTNFSGGQRQRLAIARALVARPRVYLFDDSFSALDAATDAALRRALREEVAGATVVVVAQRVSTIRDADQVVVLDSGRVVGTGTHAELLRTSPTYREIVSSQDAEEVSRA